MSIELKQVAEQSLDLSTPTLREMVTRHAAVIDSRATLEDMPEALAFQIDMARALLREFAAIQQAEAQQPSSKEHLFELWWEAHMPNATQEQAWTAFTAAVASNGVGIAAQQPATGEPTPQDVVDAFEKARAGSDKPVGILRGVRAVMRLLPDLKPAPDPIAPATPEPVQADSSEHLRVIASLGAALRRLSFAAQTTGGTDGPDAELQSAIGQAEQALSLGGIWQAMSATGEPVWCVATGERVNGEETYTHHDAYVPLADCFPLYTHPAPSVPDDVVRDAERYRWLRDEHIGNCPESINLSHGRKPGLDEAIDAAMLAAKEGGAA